MPAQVHELCSIVHRTADEGVTTRCRPVKDARKLTNLLLLKGDMTATSALESIDALVSSGQSENKDELFALTAPAPAGLLIIDELEMCVLSYYEGEPPGRIRLVEAMVDYKCVKLGQKKGDFEDMSLIIEAGLARGRVSHAEMSDVRVEEPVFSSADVDDLIKMARSPDRKRLVSFAQVCKTAMGASWMAASVILRAHPWTVENYASPFGNRENITAIRERITDMGLPLGKDDERKWGRHWQNPSSKELF